MGDYRIAAHPTKYGDVMFRSRHEATWAAFFDKLGWAWDYEPFDLIGWVPDFLLRGFGEDVLVEVKPTDDMLFDCVDRLMEAAPGRTILLAGEAPLSSTFAWKVDRTGRIGTAQLARHDRTGVWGMPVGGGVDFCSGKIINEVITSGPGDDEGGVNCYEFWDESPAHVDRLWKEASNLTRKKF